MRISDNPGVAPPLDCYLEARTAFTGDIATELAVMLIDHVRESRQLDREQNRAETAQLRLAQAAQVRDLREEADKLREAGRVRGASMIFSGGVNIASGFATASTAAEGTASATDEAAASATDEATASGTPESTPSTPAFDWRAGLNGSAGAVNGGSEAWAAHIDRNAALARSRATEHEHQAGEAERRLDALDEARSHSKKLEQSAFDHLKNVQETQANIDRASTTWRA